MYEEVSQVYVSDLSFMFEGITWKVWWSWLTSVWWGWFMARDNVGRMLLILDKWVALDRKVKQLPTPD